MKIRKCVHRGKRRGSVSESLRIGRRVVSSTPKTDATNSRGAALRSDVTEVKIEDAVIVGYEIREFRQNEIVGRRYDCRDDVTPSTNFENAR